MGGRNSLQLAYRQNRPRARLVGRDARSLWLLFILFDKLESRAAHLEQIAVSQQEVSHASLDLFDGDDCMRIAGGYGENCGPNAGDLQLRLGVSTFPWIALQLSHPVLLDTRLRQRD